MQTAVSVAHRRYNTACSRRSRPPKIQLQKLCVALARLKQSLDFWAVPMEIDRSLETITTNDLTELYSGSIRRLAKHFISGPGAKWQALYDIERPLAVALCQGAALHFANKTNGVKDFDVWFFYAFNKTHLPYRTIWNWDYTNSKFGHRPNEPDYVGRRVDVLVRSIRNYVEGDPIRSVQSFLEKEGTASSLALAKKAVVLIAPDVMRGRVIWNEKKI